jgi:hypothetical protein
MTGFLGATRTARVLAAVIVGLLATGVLTGGLWAWIAPPIHGVVGLNRAGERWHDYLGDESEHFFVAAFLMLGLLSVVAVVTPVLSWQWRAHRGPWMVVGLSIGLVAAAGAAVAVGTIAVRLRFGAVDIAATPLNGDNSASGSASGAVRYFTQAPPVFFGHSPMQIACTVLLPAGVSALAYAVLAATAARDDLGSSPTADSLESSAVVTISPGG